MPIDDLICGSYARFAHAVKTKSENLIISSGFFFHVISIIQYSP